MSNSSRDQHAAQSTANVVHGHSIRFVQMYIRFQSRDCFEQISVKRS
jgi:hypothetical protein